MSNEKREICTRDNQELILFTVSILFAKDPCCGLQRQKY